MISFFSLKALFDHEPADQSCELHIADPPRMSSRKAAPKLLGSLGTLDLGPWDLDGDLDGDHVEQESTLLEISASIGE